MNFRIVSLLICSLVFSLTSCKKHEDNLFLANEGTQGFDGYSFTDSFSLFTSTVREDSIQSDSLSHNLIGVINDPVFGNSIATSFAQFKLPELNKVISSNRLDSVVLFIQFTSSTAYYGDLASEIAFNVHEVNEVVHYNSTHSNQTYSYDPTVAGTFSGVYHPADSLKIRNLGKIVKVAPAISIKLSAAMANKFFNATATDLSSQTNFLQFFKGFAFVPANAPVSGQGAIAAFNFQGANTSIRIYYNDSLQSDFRVIDNARRFSNYKISNQSNLILTQKSAVFPADFEINYIQAMTGAKMRIHIPWLFGVIKKDPLTKKDRKISVGKAELIIRPLAGTYASPFTLPARLLVLQPDADKGLNSGITDLIEPFYGGNYNSLKNEYRFNITRHIQGLFTDYQLKGINSNRGLYVIVPSDFPIAPSRIIVDARKGIADAGIEFKLIYTEL